MNLRTHEVTDLGKSTTFGANKIKCNDSIDKWHDSVLSTILFKMLTKVDNPQFNQSTNNKEKTITHTTELNKYYRLHSFSMICQP